MAFDPVYDKFVLPYYQEEKRARLAAEAKILQCFRNLGGFFQRGGVVKLIVFNLVNGPLSGKG